MDVNSLRFTLLTRLSGPLAGLPAFLESSDNALFLPLLEIDGDRPLWFAGDEPSKLLSLSSEAARPELPRLRGIY